MSRSGYHGDSGPMVVSDSNVTEVTQVFLRAAEELGYKQGDLNGANQERFSHNQVGTNSSPALPISVYNT